MVLLREPTHNAWTTKQRMEHFKKQTETTKDGPFYESSFVSCFCIIKWYILCLFVVLHKMIHPLLFVWAYWMVRPLLFRMAPQPVPYFVVWFCYANQYTKCFIRSDAKRDSQVWSIFWSTTRKQRMDHCMKQTLCDGSATWHGTSFAVCFIQCFGHTVRFGCASANIQYRCM